MKFVHILLLLVACARVALSARACDGSLNTNDKGLNPGCTASAPYCVGGACIPCNPYYGDDYVCDCPAGQGCCRDQSNAGCKLGTCVVMGKYGSPCSQSAPDCTTTYSGYPEYTVQLECVAGVCRYCDPSQFGAANLTTCPAGVSQAGQTRNCVAPGLWATPGSSTTLAAATASASSTASTAATGAAGITTTSDAADFSRPAVLLVMAIMLAAWFIMPDTL